jgi:anthranilate synthase/aminodeoxychorismate synthase-like glutamine amidotransferase
MFYIAVANILKKRYIEALGGMLPGNHDQGQASAVLLIVIDNYDSFTYNLAQGFAQLGASLRVFRSDEISVGELARLDPDGLLISPGPATPDEAGISCDAIRAFAGSVPILGVCLGMQCIAQVFGAGIVRTPEPVHGKTSLVQHDGKGVFATLPNPLKCMRYHSLMVEQDSLPNELEITATTADGVIMGLRHRRFPVEGVQFHPESVLAQNGMPLLANFLRGAVHREVVSR